jgi:hypothetical protein
LRRPRGLAAAALAAESGRLQVLDWAGYGNDGGQAMFAQYVKQHPSNKPQFTYMTNESDALAKLQAGQKPDIFRPYVGWVKYFATSGLVQPWDPKLITNFKSLNPAMVRPASNNGKQYGIPADWGFDQDPLPQRQGEAEAKSWGSALRRPLQGQDRVVRRSQHAHGRPDCTLGMKNPWNQSDAELAGSQKLLKVEEAPRAPHPGLPRRTCGRRSAPASSGSPTRGRTTGCR